MEQLEIIIPGGQKLSVRDFVEWEYNGGKADFQPDEHYPLWGTVPIEDKLRYIAISVFGDLASYGNTPTESALRTVSRSTTSTSRFRARMKIFFSP